MRDIWVAIFGTYAPLTDSMTGEVLPGLAGVDWPYIFGAIAFLIALYSFFK